MPAITTGFSLRLPSFLFPSSPHLCIQWSSSLRLTRKPDGFEAPIFIPWQDKIAYKFIVDGRWMSNNTEPTEIDHGYVNNVYTAPPKPPPQEPKPIPPQPSYPPESQVELGHAEKLPEEHVANGFTLDEPHDAPTSAAEPEPEMPIEEVKAVVTPVVEGAVAQVAPDPEEVEKASDEVRSNPHFLKKLDHILTMDNRLRPRSNPPRNPPPPFLRLSLVLSRSTQHTLRMALLPQL